MSFHRNILPGQLIEEAALTSHLIGMGIRLQGRAKKHVNIEDGLYSASVEGMAGDLRVLSLLVDWIDLHYQRIIVDRLFRIVSESSEIRVRAFWAAIAQWKKTDPRFKRFRSLHHGNRLDLLPTGTDFHLSKKGEDARFSGSPLRVPEGVGLRQRASDILSPKELAKHHLPYYFRLLIGATYRADMWAYLTLDPELTPSELARRSYGSFATAWHVKEEWHVIQEAAA